MATVIVTGASGFVGCRLVPMLVTRGHRVIATSRRQQTYSASTKKQKTIEWREISAESSDQEWRDLIQEGDYLIHLAARVHVMREKPQDALPAHLKTNTDFTKRLATISEEQELRRFVFVSTIKVLGEKTLESPFDEISRDDPQDPYSESKRLAEIALREVCASGNMEFVIVRPTLVIGDGASGNLDRLIRWIASRWPIPLGGISNSRSLVSVETLCEILIRSLDNQQVADETILAAEPDAISTPELIESLARGYRRPARLLKMPRFFFGFFRQMPFIGKSVARLTESLVVDSSATYAKLGWRPVVSIRDRLQAVGERFRDSTSS